MTFKSTIILPVIIRLSTSGLLCRLELSPFTRHCLLLVNKMCT